VGLSSRSTWDNVHPSRDKGYSHRGFAKPSTAHTPSGRPTMMVWTAQRHVLYHRYVKAFLIFLSMIVAACHFCKSRVFNKSHPRIGLFKENLRWRIGLALSVIPGRNNVAPKSYWTRRQKSIKLAPIASSGEPPALRQDRCRGLWRMFASLTLFRSRFLCGA